MKRKILSFHQDELDDWVADLECGHTQHVRHNPPWQERLWVIYLARVYRLVSERFHLSEWDASILHKLQTLENIYQKMSDEAVDRRMELLEWIIIILIAVEIVLSFFPSIHH